MSKPVTECEKCLDYLTRRRTVLLPHVGRWVQRQEVPTPPSVIVGRLLWRAHARH